MFEVKNVKNYDEHHSYGTDWVTEYEINSNEELTIDEVIQKLLDSGHSPYGANSMKKTENGYILKAVMY